jgi:hypothetical protein
MEEFLFICGGRAGGRNFCNGEGVERCHKVKTNRL